MEVGEVRDERWECKEVICGKQGEAGEVRGHRCQWNDDMRTELGVMGILQYLEIMLSK